MYAGSGQMPWLDQNLQQPPSLWNPVDWHLGTWVLLHPTSAMLPLPIQLLDLEDVGNFWLVLEILCDW